MNNRIRALAVAAGLWAAFSAAAFSAIDTGDPWNAAPIAAEPTLGDLKSVDELKTLFNQDRGKARLVLLLSPT
ncbi:MAG TPA: hypothetical protein VFZ98_06690 [Vicinamibacterales bacterium]